MATVSTGRWSGRNGTIRASTVRMRVLCATRSRMAGFQGHWIMMSAREVWKGGMPSLSMRTPVMTSSGVSGLDGHHCPQIGMRRRNEDLIRWR